MFAVGHFALGYLTGKISAKFLNASLNLPLVFFASVLPDSDILFPFLEHRGPMHSVLFCCILFLPLFWKYKKRAVPYFIVVLQHSLIGDFLTGGTQIFWPFSMELYGIDIGIRSTYNMGLEWLLFAVSVVVMLKANELRPLLKPNSLNFILLLPLMTVLLPIIVNFPLYIPMFLLIPHVFFIGLFVVSLYVSLRGFQN